MKLVHCKQTNNTTEQQNRKFCRNSKNKSSNFLTKILKKILQAGCSVINQYSLFKANYEGVIECHLEAMEEFNEFIDK